MAENLVRIDSSKRRPGPANERSLGPADPRVKTTFLVALRRNPEYDKEWKDEIDEYVERRKPHMTHVEHQSKFGATDEDREAVIRYYQGQHFVLKNPRSKSRLLKFEGTVEQVNQAFKTTMELFESNHPKHGTQQYRGNPGDLFIPKELQGIIRGVYGFDERPVAAPLYMRPHAIPQGVFTAPQVAQHYQFPNSVTGSGQTIGIIELGGGYQDTDLRSYFQFLNIPLPTITSVSVGNGVNQPGVDPNADGEVELDIEVAGAVAPGAKIVVYFAEQPTGADFLEAVTQAIHDTDNHPSILSISWGGPEDTSPHGKAWAEEMDQAFQDAAALGITVCAAAGDSGSGDGLSGTHVDFPASSPFTLACGGTRLTSSSSEEVWNDAEGATGGGISEIFDLPVWQKGLSVLTQSGTEQLSKRGLPDVAGDGDPETGYWIFTDGHKEPIGGTSAVAPLWAGLVALINDSLNAQIGFLNPLLYTKIIQSQAFNGITVGNNGNFRATQGWDACTGWGSPNGVQLLNQLKQAVPTSKGVTFADGIGALQREYSPFQALAQIVSDSVLNDPEIASKAVDLLDVIKMRIEEPSRGRVVEAKTASKKK